MDLTRDASTAAPRDEARDLWERFGQVAPPPPRTLRLARKPGPRRGTSMSGRVHLHPSTARVLWRAAQRAGVRDGEDVFLRLSGGDPREESNGDGVYLALFDTGQEPGTLGLMNWQRRETGFRLGTALSAEVWRPTRDTALASLRFSCAPTKPIEEGRVFVMQASSLENWVRNSNVVLRKGQSLRCDVLATGSRPACTIALTVEDIEFQITPNSGEFGHIVEGTDVYVEPTVFVHNNRSYFCVQGESFHSLRAWPVLQATLQATFKFLGAVVCAVFVVYCMLFIVGSVIKAVRAAFSFVCGISVLAPILGAIRAAVDAVVASPPFKLVLCVLYAFGPEDIKPSSPGNIALREELAEDGSAESIEVIIIIMRGLCIGWGVAEIVLALFGVHVLLKVCRYLIPVEY